MKFSSYRLISLCLISKSLCSYSYRLPTTTTAPVISTTMASMIKKSSAVDATQEINDTGKFVRTASACRDIISKDHKVYQPEFDRYHLYISYACPWANRCLSMLKLKGLDDCIKVTAVHPVWQKTKPNDPEDAHHGWTFYDPADNTPFKSPTGMGSFLIQEGCAPDTINGAKYVRDLYEKVSSSFQKYTVPVLWDKKTSTIVNNESSDILRMFNTVFSEFATGPMANHDFYPEALRAEIDSVNDWVYPDINDGVYKCGFAKSQAAYNDAVNNLYNSLERVESILSTSRYLVGNTITEADIRLFMTLVRFDEVYVVYFKCNDKRMRDYPNIRNYLRDIYQLPNFASSINMEHIKTHYFCSHPPLNTYAIIPRGPNTIQDLLEPHDRNKFN